MVDLPDHAVLIGGLDHWQFAERRRVFEDPYSVETQSAASAALLRCCPRAKLSLRAAS